MCLGWLFGSGGGQRSVVNVCMVLFGISILCVGFVVSVILPRQRGRVLSGDWRVCVEFREFSVQVFSFERF